MIAFLQTSFKRAPLKRPTSSLRRHDVYHIATGEGASLTEMVRRSPKIVAPSAMPKVRPASAAPE